ncbi:MAG TPA: cyclic nucleotide-binding domain-containing protein [Mariprofundaceae bacterium]|nr:cyclic nucleotide-binding domain-containing protein [Mariprofundaceae bacterium]
MAVDFAWLEQRILGRSLSDREKGLLGIMITELHLPAGQAVCIEPGNGGTLYLLRSGEAEVLLEWGDECLRVPSISEGAQLGDLASLLDESACATLIARDDCVAYRIRRRAFDALLASRQPLACDMVYGVLSCTASAIRELQMRRAGQVPGKRI